MFSQYRPGVRSSPCDDNGDFPAAGAARVRHPGGLALAQESGSVLLSYVAESTFICRGISHVNRNLTLMKGLRGHSHRALSVQPSSKAALEYPKTERSIRERAP